MAKTTEQKEAEKLEKEKAKAEKEAAKTSKKIIKFEDIDSSAMVNGVKARRAFKAVFGGAKPQTNEITLASQLRTENPDLKGEELVMEVYKGLGGLVDVNKAKKNRENEKKEKERKAKV